MSSFRHETGRELRPFVVSKNYWSSSTLGTGSNLPCIDCSACLHCAEHFFHSCWAGAIGLSSGTTPVDDDADGWASRNAIGRECHG